MAFSSQIYVLKRHSNTFRASCMARLRERSPLVPQSSCIDCTVDGYCHLFAKHDNDVTGVCAVAHAYAISEQAMLVIAMVLSARQQHPLSTSSDGNVVSWTFPCFFDVS